MTSHIRRQTRPRTRLAALATALLMTAACGSDDATEDASTGADTTQEETSSETTTEESSESEAQEPEGTVRGVVNVNGTAYEITELRNCEPLEQDMVETELELQGLGEHKGERVQIDVYLRTIAGNPANDVSWAGPEGVFGGPENPNVTLDAAGTSVRGVATLTDSMTQTDTVEVDFDLEVPAETIDCR